MIDAMVDAFIDALPLTEFTKTAFAAGPPAARRAPVSGPGRGVRASRAC